MKRTATAWMSSVALAGALIFPMSGLAQQQPAPAPAQQAPGKPGVGRMGGERHPEMRQAMIHLRQAKRALENSQHDFAGHRVKALEHVDQALKECQEGLQADKQ